VVRPQQQQHHGQHNHHRHQHYYNQSHYNHHPPPNPEFGLLSIQQQCYPLPGALQEQPNHLSAIQPSHDTREPPKDHNYKQQNFSGHLTPVPVDRFDAVDGSRPQHTPANPA
jgi:hypothetical protein